MDKLYIGDIPQEYHYAQFNNNYIDLYNTSVINNNTTYTYYRVYMYDNQFMYEKLNTTTGSYYYSRTNTDIEVTNDIMYRRDMPNILLMTCIFVLIGVWLINLVTSFVKKGGILGGLL